VSDRKHYLRANTINNTKKTAGFVLNINLVFPISVPDPSTTSYNVNNIDKEAQQQQL
jgi:hypothetical protein